MFVHPRIKKSAPLPPPKKRKRHYNIDEINFDDGARHEYLTGFHKRKLQRVKRAQEESEKKAREERIEMRKQIREDRQRQVEEHIKQVNTMLRDHDHAGCIDNKSESADNEGDVGGWEGFPEEPDDHEEEYIDEDKYTSVTVESVSVSRNGLHAQKNESDTENEDGKPKINETALRREAKLAKKPKQKKKRFTYESKFERRLAEKKRKAKKTKGK